MDLFDQLRTLNEIRDGYAHWRPGCGLLARRGWVYRAEYANGPHAEITDKGWIEIECLEAGDVR